MARAHMILNGIGPIYLRYVVRRGQAKYHCRSRRHSLGSLTRSPQIRCPYSSLLSMCNGFIVLRLRLGPFAR